MAKKVEPLSHPVTPDWCERVHDELRRRGRGTQARLAKHLKVSTGLLAEHLGGKYQTSNLVAGVHEFFGWPEPLPPTASLDAGELIHVANRMSQPQRDLLEEAAGVLDGVSGEHAKKALTELLRMFRSQHDNDN